MAGRIRNTKALARRIERDYFKGAFAIRRWRIYLTLIVAATGVGWLTWRALGHDQTAFSSGPVTLHHAAFAKHCDACHTVRIPVGSIITNQACQACHDGPLHHEQQTSTPKCVQCHVEHRGVAQLVGAGGKVCVSCHADLKTTSGKVTVASHIESIAKGHPEFTPLRPGRSDPGGIKFNHKIHLRADLKVPGGTVQLECNDCHRPAGIVQPWLFGRQDSGDTTAKTILPPFRSRLSIRAYMQPVSYYQHCSSCHPLLFDKRIAEPVPHKKPGIGAGVLEPQFRKYIAAHPEELRASPISTRIPRVKFRPAPRNVEEWVRVRVAESERLLWFKTCAECHTLSGVDTLHLPKVQEANIAARWLRQGSFDHSSHTMLDCMECHRQVRTSEKTSDVLLPGIKTCQTCHDPGGKEGSAGGDCFECHPYHDWSKEKPRHGPLKLVER